MNLGTFTPTITGAAGATTLAIIDLPSLTQLPGLIIAIITAVIQIRSLFKKKNQNPTPQNEA